MKKNKNLIIIIIFSILFILLTINILIQKTPTIDLKTIDYISKIRTDKLTNIFTKITNIGSSYSLIVLSILFFINFKEKKYPIAIALNLTAAFIISQLIKLIINRPRPIGIALVEASGFSYPSGHTMVSTAYFGFLIYLILKNISNKVLKIIATTFLTIIPILIGISRIYLGVHYLTDIIAGILLAIIYLIIFTKLYTKKGA